MLFDWLKKEGTNFCFECPTIEGGLDHKMFLSRFHFAIGFGGVES